jgi:hypothetical protein
MLDRAGMTARRYQPTRELLQKPVMRSPRAPAEAPETFTGASEARAELRDDSLGLQEAPAELLEKITDRYSASAELSEQDRGRWLELGLEEHRVMRRTPFA